MNQCVRPMVLALLAGGLAGQIPLAAQNANGPVCKAIHADLVEEQSTTGCKPGHASCFLGEVDGNHGLRGTTYFRGDGRGTPPPLSPAFTPYSGAFEYTTARGTIAARETGLTAPTVGVVLAFQQITETTGEFAGSTGYFFVTGSLGNGRVVTKVTGQICSPEQ